MSGDALLDANAVIGLFNKDPQATAVIRSVNAYLPSIVVGELFYGAFKSARVAQNLARVQKFLPSAVELVCDHDTGEHYGRIKNSLRAAGSPIPDNDLWIAAIALQHGLALISRDAHFDAVSGLTRVAW